MSDFDEQAIDPGAPPTTFVPEQTAKPAVDDAAKKEAEYAALVDHPQWQTFKANVEAKLRDMLDLRDINVDATDTETVGREFKAARKAEQLIKELIIDLEVKHDVAEQRRGTT